MFCLNINLVLAVYFVTYLYLFNIKNNSSLPLKPMPPEVELSVPWAFRADVLKPRWAGVSICASLSKPLSGSVGWALPCKLRRPHAAGPGWPCPPHCGWLATRDCTTVAVGGVGGETRKDTHPSWRTQTRRMRWSLESTAFLLLCLELLINHCFVWISFSVEEIETCSPPFCFFAKRTTQLRAVENSVCCLETDNMSNKCKVGLFAKSSWKWSKVRQSHSS